MARGIYPEEKKRPRDKGIGTYKWIVIEHTTYAKSRVGFHQIEDALTNALAKALSEEMKER